MKTIWMTGAVLLTLCSQASAGAAIQAVENKVAMCVGCHGIVGYRNAFPEVYRVPMIGGQSKGYLLSALQAYRKGDRKHASMQGIAGGLSDQDMEEIASYYASR